MSKKKSQMKSDGTLMTRCLTPKSESADSVSSVGHKALPAKAKLLSTGQNVVEQTYYLDKETGKQVKDISLVPAASYDRIDAYSHIEARTIQKQQRFVVEASGTGKASDCTHTDKAFASAVHLKAHFEMLEDERKRGERADLIAKQKANKLKKKQTRGALGDSNNDVQIALQTTRLIVKANRIGA